MQMEMFMMVIGLKTKLMVSEYINILMQQSMKDNGKKINSTVMDLKHGLMVLVIKVNMSKEKSMEKVISYGLMEAILLDNLLITKLKGKENTFGMMVENSSDLGNVIRWTEKAVFLHGQMAEDTKESM